jgi:hypothetical protein
MRHPILNLGCAALARNGHGVGNRWCGGILAVLRLALAAKKMVLDAFALTNSPEQCEKRRLG